MAGPVRSKLTVQTNVMSEVFVKSCLREIQAGQRWHYRYNAKAGLLEPINDRCDFSGRPTLSLSSGIR